MSATYARTDTPVNSPRQVLFASLIGTTIEFFDFYIYATAAVLVFPGLSADAHFPHIARGPDDALRIQQAESKLDVRAGRAHDDRERLAIEEQLERFFGDNGIRRLGPFTRRKAADAQPWRRGLGHVTGRRAAGALNAGPPWRYGTRARM